MKSLISSLIGLALSVSVGAESLLEGRVQLSSGQPAIGVQVRLFDLTDLRRFVGTTTDETGHFSLPLRAFSTARGTALPTDFALGQNYPNPFNPSTLIPYQLPSAGHVRLEVFNMLGQRLATLVDAERSAGAHIAQWDATDAAGQAVGAGVYIYRLSSGGISVSRRMVLVDGQAGIPTVGAAPEKMRSAVEGFVEADGPVYGLTVSGSGLIPYVNPAFRVGVDEADLVIEEHGGIPRMKLAAGGILGDVDGNGQVDVFDVLYVLLYSEDSSVVLPTNGDISLGDVNGDGRINITDAVLLLRYSSNPSDPTLPPGIGTAYGDGQGGEGGEGGVIRNLTNHSADDGYPSWSADGRSIAFISYRDGNAEIYVMDADGGNLRNLTNHSAFDGFPSWSADGRSIAFYSRRDGNREIYVMDADGGNLRNLTNHSADDYYPFWSADGRSIAFRSERDGNAEIYVMDADGSNLRNLTNHSANDYSYSSFWSADSRSIAFISYRDGLAEIYVMDADGGNLRNLTNHSANDYFSSWSADGRSIAFESERDGNAEIYVMDADGGNLRRLTNHSAYDGSPSWSADGRSIAFESYRDGNVEIYVMDADGGNLRRLTNHSAYDYSPSWSADGRSIAFVSERDGNAEIYVMDLQASDTLDKVLDDATILWQYRTDNSVNVSPTVADGVVYATSYEGHVYALDAETGKLLWSFKAASNLPSPPLVADGVVHVGDSDNHHYALNASTGELLWRDGSGSGGSNNAPLVSDGIVYIPSSPRSENFSVRAVDAASGEQMWVSEVSRSGFPLFFPLTAVGSNLYLSDDQQVHALDGTTGELVWSFHVGTQVPPTASGGVTYFVELERSEDELVYVLIYALDESTGTLLWSYKADYAALGFPFPPLVVDNVVYLAARELEALDTSTGQRLWSYDVNYPQVSTVVNGMVFVINILGSLYVLDAETGALVWSREDWQLSSVLVVNGVLYADSHDGYLHTLNARTGEPIWSVDIGYQWRRRFAVSGGVVYVGYQLADSGVYAFTAPGL